LIEGILIKLGGLVFGPIIGIFIGGITDIMTVLLTAGMFHYGYFIAALAYGFFAGIVRNIIVGKKNLFSMMILTTLFGILGTVLTNLYLYFTPSLASHNFSLSILKINVVFTYLQICLILDGTVGLILIII
jgi:LytS/YehU family sensor histidine kinase